MKYHYHNVNSRKGYVHLIYDLYGVETAHDLAEKLGIKRLTAYQWTRRWIRHTQALNQADNKLS